MVVGANVNKFLRKIKICTKKNPEACKNVYPKTGFVDVRPRLRMEFVVIFVAGNGIKLLKAWKTNASSTRRRNCRGLAAAPLHAFGNLRKDAARGL